MGQQKAKALCTGLRCSIALHPLLSPGVPRTRTSLRPCKKGSASPKQSQEPANPRPNGNKKQGTHIPPSRSSHTAPEPQLSTHSSPDPGTHEHSAWRGDDGHFGHLSQLRAGCARLVAHAGLEVIAVNTPEHSSLPARGQGKQTETFYHFLLDSVPLLSSSATQPPRKGHHVPTTPSSQQAEFKQH